MEIMLQNEINVKKIWQLSKSGQISVVPTSQWRYVLTAVVYDASLIHPTAGGEDS